MTTARYTTTPAPMFGAHVVRHRVEYRALVAEGLAPAGQLPEAWTVTRIARGACGGWAGRSLLGELREGVAGGRKATDAKGLAGVITSICRGRLAA